MSQAVVSNMTDQTQVTFVIRVAQKLVDPTRNTQTAGNKYLNPKYP